MKMNIAAFTIMELLIVMALIAILIGIAVPAFRGMQNEANLSKAQGELRTLKIALESYYKNNNFFIVEGSDWEERLTESVPQILEGVVYDKFGATQTSAYHYDLSDSGEYYVIWSNGIGGASDITGIADNGNINGVENDDLFVTNGSGTFN